MNVNITTCPIYDPSLMLDFKESIKDRRYSCKINNGMSMVAKCDECNSWFVKAGLQMKKLEQEYVFCNRECQRKSQSSGALKEKKRRVFLEKYGVDNPSSSLAIQDKKRTNSIEKHGCNFSSLPEVKAKRKATWIKNYGCDNPNKSPEVMAKRRATTLKKYGCEDYLGTKEARNGLREYSMKTYGTEHFMQSPEFMHDVFEQGFINKYGVSNPQKVEAVKAKVRATCMVKYGVDNTLKTPKAREAFYLALNNNTCLSSKIEDEFFACLQGHVGSLGYTAQHQINIRDRWLVDFYIPEIDTYIEFDGVFWHGINKTIEELQEQVDKSKSKTGIWKAVLNKKHKDSKENKWFKVCGKKLVRITDEEYLKAKKQGNVKEMLDKLLGTGGN